MGLKSFYTVKEASEKLGLSTDSIANFVRDGKLHQFRDGGEVYYRIKEVDAFQRAMDNELPLPMQPQDIPEGSIPQNMSPKLQTSVMDLISAYNRNQSQPESPMEWKDVENMPPRINPSEPFPKPPPESAITDSEAMKATEEYRRRIPKCEVFKRRGRSRFLGRPTRDGVILSVDGHGVHCPGLDDFWSMLLRDNINSALNQAYRAGTEKGKTT